MHADIKVQLVFTSVGTTRGQGIIRVVVVRCFSDILIFGRIELNIGRNTDL